MFVEGAILFGVLLFVFYKWSTATYNYFDGRNIPVEKPAPLLGSGWRFWFMKESLQEYFCNYRKHFPNKLFGNFNFREPAIVINDPELAKKVMIKDFDHFVNKKSIIDPEGDELFGNSLLALQNQKWKAMRTKLTPAFTGSKIRVMFSLVLECCKEGVEYVKSEIAETKSDGKEIDMKEYFTRFTNDIIATSAFGFKVNSFKDRDNEFYTMGRSIAKFNLAIMLKSLLYLVARPVAKFFGITLFDKKISNYFSQVVISTMKHRQENNITRPDMINLLMGAKNAGYIKSDDSHAELQTWTDSELAAQCFLFFLAGFEPTANILSFCAYELMMNPEAQDKLIEEIDATPEATYESINSLKYLDMVVSETLRKWPPLAFVDRICSKPYLLTNEEGDISFQIRQGESVLIPVIGFHYNSDVFPNPKKFDPERFSDENKANTPQGYFLPFGSGPRNCIGSRFALMEIKAIFFQLLSEFRLEKSEKTCEDIEKDFHKYTMMPKSGFWMKLVPRK